VCVCVCANASACMCDGVMGCACMCVRIRRRERSCFVRSLRLHGNSWRNSPSRRQSSKDTEAALAAPAGARTGTTSANVTSHGHGALSPPRPASAGRSGRPVSASPLAPPPAAAAAAGAPPATAPAAAVSVSGAEAAADSDGEIRLPDFDPINWLAQYLFRHNPRFPERALASDSTDARGAAAADGSSDR
jgi:hypothetical protein